MKDRKITASGEECPCGAGAYGRIAKLNLHFDKCSRHLKGK